MIKYNPELKIETKYVCLDGSCTNVFVYWRVVPKELNIFMRLFFNPWRKVIFVPSDSAKKGRLFYYSQYKRDVFTLKTVKDISNYNNKMNERFKKNLAKEKK